MRLKVSVQALKADLTKEYNVWANDPNQYTCNMDGDKDFPPMLVESMYWAYFPDEPSSCTGWRLPVTVELIVALSALVEIAL